MAGPSFESLYALARGSLPERLRLLKVAPEDIGDIVHEVVLIAHRKAGGYRPPISEPKGVLGARHALEAWLFGIAWRYVVKRRSRAHRRYEVPSGDAANLHTAAVDEAPDSEQVVANAQRHAALVRMLRTLRPERAEVLVLHTVWGMSVPEIADCLSVKANTVKSRLSRARFDALAAVKRMNTKERSAL